MCKLENLEIVDLYQDNPKFQYTNIANPFSQFSHFHIIKLSNYQIISNISIQYITLRQAQGPA